MNFKVFFRSLFLVVVLLAVVFTVYSNKKISDGSEQSQSENSNTIIAGTTALNNSADNQTNSNEDSNDLSQTEVLSENSSNKTTSHENSPSRSYIKEKVAINISALGDVALGQDWSFKYGDSFDYVFEKIKGDYSYFFSGVLDVLSQDDLTIANLETTLSNETEKAEKYDYGNNYWFNGRPEFANILKAGSVEVANLANNHTYDYGQKGYDATRKALQDVEIDYFGYADVLYKDVKGIRIGMVGFNQLGNVEQGLDMNVFKKEVAEMTAKLRGECDLVIASFHWGKEYQYQQNGLQKELAYLAIDSGADLVIGNHPHVLQPIEKYNGKYIAYSLGNFCFGGNKTPKDYDTAIYQQTFIFDSDNILQPITEPTIIPCSVSSQKNLNNYKPAIAVEPQYSNVLKKLDFSSSAISSTGDAGTVNKKDMVRLDNTVKDIVIDLKYATTDNIVGKKVYESNVAYLRKGTADKLNKANQILLKEGYRIKVWDAYRAQKYQKILYDSATNKDYFMDPEIGSNHTRGAAVDVTLINADGEEVNMPSGFDEMSSKAHRTYTQATPEQKKNALLLENAMKSSGFTTIQKEWWHFDDSEYKSYELLQDYPE